MFKLEGLNPEQRSCVTTLSGPLMLLAGAGTGKTRVITFRIANMLRHGIAPQQIVALTFTNKAAREMKERITDLAPQSAKDLTVSTFHSFCLRLLKKYAKDAGLTARFSIAGVSDQLDLVRRSLEEKGWAGTYRAESIQAAISYAKNQLWTADDILSQGVITELYSIDPVALSQIFVLYERQLRLHQAIDFDDCIYLTVQMLEKHPVILQQLQSQYRHMLVDEFQDTNFSQLKVIELLCKTNENICVVGDDDQSIYSWRGAMAEVLIKFEELFPKRILIKLEQNYRCTTIILDAANAVIKNNEMRKGKKLWSKNESKTSIILATKPDEVEEARWIAQRIMGLLGKGYKASDVAILYRANALNRNLEIALRELNLNYKIFGGQSVFERKEIKDLLGYLRIVSNPHHRLAFLRVINTPVRGFGLKTLEKLEQYAAEKKVSLYTALSTFSSELNTKAAGLTAQFIEHVSNLAKRPLRTRSDLEILIREVISLFRLEADIRANTATTHIADRKIESLRRVPDWMGNYAERYLQDHDYIDLSEILDQLTLNESDVRDGKDDTPKISLMTIHGAKGLEFPCVFVCGLEDGIFPHKNSFDLERGIDEERRLFYVALTRAKEHLHLSYALTRSIGGGTSETKPSRFLDEIPKETLILEHALANVEKVSEDVRKERTKSRLSSLRSSFRETQK